jgi:hypothetical protein
MRRVLITVFASLLAVALIPAAAQAATQVRQVQSEMTMPATSPQTGVVQVPAGRLTLDFVFKNTRGNKKKFTPRGKRLFERRGRDRLDKRVRLGRQRPPSGRSDWRFCEPRYPA